MVVRVAIVTDAANAFDAKPTAVALVAVTAVLNILLLAPVIAMTDLLSDVVAAVVTIAVELEVLVGLAATANAPALFIPLA